MNFYAFCKLGDSQQSCDITRKTVDLDIYNENLTIKVYSQHNRDWLTETIVQNLKFLGKSFSSTQLGWVMRHSKHFSWKHPNNSFSNTKTTIKTSKHEWWKSLPKTNIKTKNLFDLITISLSAHTSHSNT